MDSKHESYLLNEKGFNLFKQKNYSEAMKILTQSINLNPNNTDAWYNKASCLCEMGRIEEGLNDYVHVLELDPRDEMAKRIAINVEAELGINHPKLNNYLTPFECTKFGIDLYNGFLSTGDKEKLEGAINFFKKAIQLDPGYSEARKYLEMDQLQKAQVYKKELLRYTTKITQMHESGEQFLTQDWYLVYYNRGVCNNGLGRYREAIKDFEIVLNLLPDDPDTVKQIQYARQHLDSCKQ